MDNVYTVIKIIENDYGCEGVPDGQEPTVKVRLCDESGAVLWITESDALLYRLGIDEGDRVVYDGVNLRKA
ncbi:MAG: hypothetical protein MRZ61_11350 [Oscillospiraceae bacterium]|nr:hypothetical protein [Oscillospiraceae bacterium]